MDRRRPQIIARASRARLIGWFVALAAAGTCAPAAGQMSISAEERFFKIQWQAERDAGGGTAIVGLLSNPYSYAVQRVQLRVEVLDGAGQITTETFPTIANDIPAGGRSSFRLPLPATGARYIVTVHTFEFGPRESP